MGARAQEETRVRKRGKPRAHERGKTKTKRGEDISVHHQKLNEYIEILRQKGEGRNTLKTNIKIIKERDRRDPWAQSRSLSARSPA
jgi:hypothetical protein